MSALETRRPASRALLWVALTLFVVLYGFPFLYLLLTSFKTPLETLAVPPSVLPSTWTLANYAEALSRDGVAESFINSIVTAALSTALSLVLALPAAYAVTRFRTPLGRVFIVGALITRMVPAIVVGVPLVPLFRARSAPRTPHSPSRSPTPPSASRCPSG
jgi:multiple sugar transport system permease protein